MTPFQVDNASRSRLEFVDRPDRPDHEARRRSIAARAPRAADLDRVAEKRAMRTRPPQQRDDGGYDEFFSGRKLLKSLDSALALPAPARNRAFAQIVLGVDAGMDQERDGDCECMAPDLGALIAVMARDGVDDDTRHSALELSMALQRLAEHGGLDRRHCADLEGFAERLKDLPPII